MIVIPGHVRTGTSVMFKCLEKSGCNGGTKLFGHKYATQDEKLNALRWELDNYRDEIKKRKLGHKADVFWNKYCIVNGINLVKDPWLWVVFPYMYELCKEFRSYKFIWMTRDKVEAAKSAVRLQQYKDMPPVDLNPVLTDDVMIKAYDKYQNMLCKWSHQVDSVIINFENMLDDPEKTGEILESFLGFPVNMSLVSKKETFKAMGEPQ